ncbi:hypothetical protein AMECASPLE_020833 [Ameca splendens]|uniref:Uncharacterized protein n=1 Tax=Ameca splendens TaxID=208324 RepID=A0ABV0ZZ25_9TELE
MQLLGHGNPFHEADCGLYQPLAPLCVILWPTFVAELLWFQIAYTLLFFKKELTIGGLVVRKFQELTCTGNIWLHYQDLGKQSACLAAIMEVAVEAIGMSEFSG